MISICFILFLSCLADLQFTLYDNLALSGTPVQNHTISTSKGLHFSVRLEFPASFEILGTLSPETEDNFLFQCNVKGVAGAWFLFLGDHLICVSDIYHYSVGEWDNPLVLDPAQKYVVRLEAYAQKAGQVDIEIDSSGDPMSFAPSLPSLEITRRKLQKSLVSNWGNWVHHDILTYALMPEGSAFGIGFCDSSTCTSDFNMPDKDKNGVHVRVGPLAYDRSYGQLYAAWLPKKLNVSISFSVTPLQDLYLSIEIISNECTSCVVMLSPRYPWNRMGETNTTTNSIILHAYNMRKTSLHVVPSGIVNGTLLKIPVTSNIFISTTDASPHDIEKVIGDAKEAEFARYDKYGNFSEVKLAVQAAVMWNMIYTPAEMGPLSTVSRGWDKTLRGPHGSKDFGYALFDWDNIFGAYILGLDNTQLAYSNLIQIMKTKTAAGFVPNVSGGGMKSQDRTEPPIGAYVTRELYNKYKDPWLVEFLFPDLVDWNDWFFKERVLPPLNMIALGSSHRENFNRVGSETMQGARFESGLDNSPMYDGNFWNKSLHLMELYDVGMNSMVIAESDAIADLAKVLGKADVAKRMTSRANALRSLVREHLWDDSLGIYVNKFRNGTFNRRIAPTSFYVMLAKVPTNEQVERMIKEWLQSPKRFCITTDWPVSNSDDCFWGLPSISADDSAFPALGYWRGYVWGPMAQLVFWSLQQYSDMPLVNSARAQLCKQMTAMMMQQWRSNKHICENFSPHRNAYGTDCTGTKFYHWGALAGLISLIEEGYYD